jgi:hypothetical protein
LRVEYVAFKAANSGTDPPPPFVRETQSGGTLVGITTFPQPFWNPTLIGAVLLETILYTAVKSVPLIGDWVRRFDAAARWMVSPVSVGVQIVP